MDNLLGLTIGVIFLRLTFRTGRCINCSTAALGLGVPIATELVTGFVPLESTGVMERVFSRECTCASWEMCATVVSDHW